MLLAEDPAQPAAREIVGLRDDTVAAMERGDPRASGARFLDYWMGPGTWAGMPELRRDAVAAAMRGVTAEWHAAFTEQTELAAFGSLDVPTLCLSGQAEAPADTACRDMGTAAQAVTLPGSHHFNGKYDDVGQVVLTFIQKRLAAG